MTLAIFNFLLMSMLPPVLIILTKRNHMKSCIFIATVVAEYVICSADFGLVIESIAAMMVYVNFKEMFTTCINQIISILH